MSQNEEESILDIRLRLTGQAKERFLKIKTSKGLTNNTEVVRLIINEYYEENFVKVAR
jgi:hypothetical protein